MNDKNRYAKIHVMFRVLAEEKLGPTAKLSDVTAKAMEVKRYWKNFFSVGSLTELDNESLDNLCVLVEKRIETLKNQKVEK